MLCILFFAVPLVRNYYSENASGWQIATSTGNMESPMNNPLVFALLIFPGILFFTALINKSFTLLRNISAIGFVAQAGFYCLYTGVKTLAFQAKPFRLTSWSLVKAEIGTLNQRGEEHGKLSKNSS